MNILRYYEAKAQNRNTLSLLRELEEDGRVRSLPGSMGIHYNYFNMKSHDAIRYQLENEFDKYHIQVLSCANMLQGHYNSINGDVRITGATHYCRNKHLCAICGTKEARRISSQLAFNFQLNKKYEYDYYMLTLTLPNFKEGFREGFAIYNKTLNSVLTHCGFIHSELDNPLYSPCQGFFASREVTYNKKDKTWHPHIHVILAYNKGSLSEVKLSKKGYVKSAYLKTGRCHSLNVNSIMNAFIMAIHKKFPDYEIPRDKHDNEFLDIDFRPITDIDNSVNEICKYFIDYRCFCDSDTLYTYLCDSFGLHKYSKQGCFGWNKKKEELWNKWLDAGRPTENSHFMEFDSDKYIYFGERVGQYKGVKYKFPCYYTRDIISENIYFSYRSDSEFYGSEFVDKISGSLRKVYLDQGELKKLHDEPRPEFNLIVKKIIESDRNRNVIYAICAKDKKNE